MRETLKPRKNRSGERSLPSTLIAMAAGTCEVIASVTLGDLRSVKFFAVTRLTAAGTLLTLMPAVVGTGVGATTISSSCTAAPCAKAGTQGRIDPAATSAAADA